MANRTRVHRPIGDSDAARARRLREDRFKYDYLRRNDPVRLFYLSKEWKDVRNKFIHNNPNCVECGAPATQIDHIETVRSHWNLRLNLGNLQSLCQSCHSRKTAYEGFAKPGERTF